MKEKQQQRQLELSANTRAAANQTKYHAAATKYEHLVQQKYKMKIENTVQRQTRNPGEVYSYSMSFHTVAPEGAPNQHETQNCVTRTRLRVGVVPQQRIKQLWGLSTWCLYCFTTAVEVRKRWRRVRNQTQPSHFAFMTARFFSVTPSP